MKKTNDEDAKAEVSFDISKIFTTGNLTFSPLGCCKR